MKTTFNTMQSLAGSIAGLHNRMGPPRGDPNLSSLGNSLFFYSQFF